jgi:hypothetical protein
LQKQSFKFKLHLPEMQVCHTLVEAPCNPQVPLLNTLNPL